MSQLWKPVVAAFAVVSASACTAPRQVIIDNITRIETSRRFVNTDSSQPPATAEGVVVREGEELAEVMRGAKCQEGSIEWTNGIGATLTFKVGNPVHADGFTESGHRLKIHSRQWCQLSDEGWAAMWRQPAPTP